MRGLRAAWRRSMVALATLAGGICLAATGVRAQAWEFYATPYLWVTNVQTKVNTGRAAGAETDLPFTKIMGHLDMVPVIMGGEARYGRFSLAFDLIWLKLKDDLDTNGPLFDGGRATLAQLEFMTLGFYRVVDEQTVKFDAGGGFRLWNYQAKLKLHPGLAPGATEKVETTFVDPILALRANIGFAPGWSATLYGDIGGFGISSKITWQALGTINYQIASWAELRAGYRYLMFDRQKFENSLSGPILGSTFRF